MLHFTISFCIDLSLKQLIMESFPSLLFLTWLYFHQIVFSEVSTDEKNLNIDEFFVIKELN